MAGFFIAQRNPTKCSNIYSNFQIIEKVTAFFRQIRFYDALADNEPGLRELSNETLKKIAYELTENLRRNIAVDWSQRESVRAKLRLMVKRILRKYKYPPDQQELAIELVLQQASGIGRGLSLKACLAALVECKYHLAG